MRWWSRKEGSGWECRGLVHEFVSGSNKLASPLLFIFYVFNEGKEQAEEYKTTIWPIHRLNITSGSHKVDLIIQAKGKSPGIALIKY